MSNDQRDAIINLLVATILSETAYAIIFAHVLREGCMGFKYMDDQQLLRAADCWDIEIDDVAGQTLKSSNEPGDLCQ